MTGHPVDQLPSLRSVIESFDLRAKKSLGQNFLFDPGITDRIAYAAGDVAGKSIVEIGPGPGGLTRSLLRSVADRVVAIEFDPRACAAMQAVQAVVGDRLVLVQDDALKLNWTTWLAQYPGAVIVSNLPYNISTVLLAGWLQVIALNPVAISRMVLMFQKEVADRLLAKPHTKDYGRLSILAQWMCQIDHVMTLPPGAFVPPPKIYSTVLRFIPRQRSGDDPSWQAMDSLLTQAFAQRRKMLRSNLREYVPLLEQCGIDPTLRAEDVPLADYLRLAKLIEQGAL